MCNWRQLMPTAGLKPNSPLHVHYYVHRFLTTLTMSSGHQAGDLHPRPIGVPWPPLRHRLRPPQCSNTRHKNVGIILYHQIMWIEHCTSYSLVAKIVLVRRNWFLTSCRYSFQRHICNFIITLIALELLERVCSGKYGHHSHFCRQTVM